MKRILKIVLGTIAVIFLLLLVLPVIFKGKIEKRVKTEINKQVNAIVDYKSFSLSLFRHFPDLSVSLEGLSVVGKDQFEGDSLLSIKEFSTSVDVLSAISGEVEIKSVLIDQPMINALVLPDSTANWDIALAVEEVEEEVIDTVSGTSDFKILLESFEIKNARIAYVDQTMALTAVIDGFNLALSGDMSQTTTDLKIQSDIDGVFVTFEEVDYLNGATVSLDAGIGADLEQLIFTFLENELVVNGLALQMDGSVVMKEEAYGLDLKLGAKKTDFKTLLALVPEVYLQDFESLKTAGELVLNVTVEGDYVDADQLPAFDVNLQVSDAMIQYTDLPKSLQDINIKLKVNNPGGSPDSTYTALEQFHFKLGDNPFDASLEVTTPVSNLTFKGGMRGRIDLSSLADAIPMDSFDIKGLIEADVTLDGDYAMIEKEQYDQVQANGKVLLNDFSFSNADLPQGVLISQAEITFSPRYVDLKSFSSQIGESDFNLKGRLENYLGYALKDGTLKGKLSHHSKYINSNEFMTEAPEPEVTELPDDTTALEIVEVPKNLDVVFASEIDKLLYDKLIIRNMKGGIVVRDGRVLLDGLKMNLLNGALTMGGQYNTQNMEKPFVDFQFAGQNIDINMAANSFSVVDSMVPIAKKAVGNVSPNFNYYSELGADFMPVIETMDGKGKVKSKGVEVSGSKIQNGLASMLKNEKYKVMKAEDFNINFKIDKGSVIVSPFKTKVYGKEIEIQGVQSIDQSINYKMTMPFSRKEVAGMAGLMGLSLPTSGDDLMVDVIVTGTIKEPELKLDLEKASKVVGKELEKEAEKAVKKILEDPDTKKKVDDLLNNFLKKKKK